LPAHLSRLAPGGRGRSISEWSPRLGPRQVRRKSNQIAPAPAAVEDPSSSPFARGSCVRLSRSSGAAQRRRSISRACRSSSFQPKPLRFRRHCSCCDRRCAQRRRHHNVAERWPPAVRSQGDQTRNGWRLDTRLRRHACFSMLAHLSSAKRPSAGQTRAAPDQVSRCGGGGL